MRNVVLENPDRTKQRLQNSDGRTNLSEQLSANNDPTLGAIGHKEGESPCKREYFAT
jgi:hypothetical protein